MGLEIITKLVEIAEKLDVDYREFESPQLYYSRAETLLQVLHDQYSKSIPEINFFAEMLIRLRSGITHAGITSTESLFRTKAINAFIELTFSNNPALKDLDHLRIDKYLAKISESTQNYSKHKILRKNISAYQVAFQLGAQLLFENKIEEKESNLPATNDCSQLLKYSKNHYDILRTPDLSELLNNDRQNQILTGLKLGDEGLKNTYPQILEQEIQNEYFKLFKTEIEYFELEFLAETIARIDLGIQYYYLSNNPGEEENLRVRLMRTIYDSIFDVGEYQYDLMSVLNTADALIQISKKPNTNSKVKISKNTEDNDTDTNDGTNNNNNNNNNLTKTSTKEYEIISQNIELYRLLIANLCTEELINQSVREKIEKNWKQDQEQKLIEFIYENSNLNYSETEEELFIQILLAQKEYLGFNLDEFILTEQIYFSFHSNEEFEDEDPMEKLGFIELQIAERFKLVIDDDSDFTKLEKKTLTKLINHAEKYFEEANPHYNSKQYQTMKYNSDETLILLQEYLQEELEL